jgi:3-oxoadipate enol-lactonase
MTKEIASIDGIRLAFRLEGPEDAPVVVLAHPLAVSAEIWGYQLPLLTTRFRVLLPDIRGHGSSEAGSDSFTLAALAGDIAGLLRYLEIRQVTFVGLSISGMIGQVFALEHPDLLRALVLCSTGCHTNEQMSEVLAQRIQSVQAQGIEPLLRPTLERWLTAPFIAASSHTTSWIAHLIRATTTAGYAACCRAMQTFDVRDQLGQIAVPTLLMPGEKDTAFPPEVAAWMQARIRGAQLRTVPEAMHLGNVEKAHVFNEILSTFLAEI